jgi:hypothetical protein
MAMQPRQQTVARTLSRNDRYLSDLVESHDICPYAKRCREDGRLARAVCWTTAPDVERAIEAIVALENRAEDEIEVALLIFPGLSELTWRRFDEFHAAVRQRYEERFGRDASYYVVPFHPDYDRVDRDQGTLVRFWRKSPDPTFQFVSIEALEPLRKKQHEITQSRMAAELLAQKKDPKALIDALADKRLRPSASELVAMNNLKSYRTLGAATFERIHAQLSDVEGDNPGPEPIDPTWKDTNWQIVQ